MESLLARREVRNYVRPADVSEALRLLIELGPAAAVVGGGTDLALRAPAGLTTLIDLSRLPLAYIEGSGGAVAVGATTTLTEMMVHPLLAGFADGLLPLVLEQVGSPALRNVATVGGHLSRGRLSDLVPALLVLDAEVRCFDGAEHRVPLAELYGSQWHERPLLITEVVLPAAARELATGFVRFSRTAFDFAILNCAVAVGLDAGRVAVARVAVGETPALARRIADVEALLLGRVFDDEAIAEAADLARSVVATGSDQRASAAYRSQLVLAGVRRCLRLAARREEVAP